MAPRLAFPSPSFSVEEEEEEEEEEIAGAAVTVTVSLPASEEEEGKLIPSEWKAVDVKEEAAQPCWVIVVLS
jgi:hypothetical protein